MSDIPTLERELATALHDLHESNTDRANWQYRAGVAMAEADTLRKERDEAPL